MTNPDLKALLGGFLDGFSGGNLFAPARRPGAPTQIFADEGSEYPQRQLVEVLRDLSLHRSSTKGQDVTRDSI